MSSSPDSGKSPVDSIGRTWDRLLPASECVALCALMFVDASVAKLRWREIDAPTREKLARGFRRAIELGAECSRAVLRL